MNRLLANGLVRTTTIGLLVMGAVMLTVTLGPAPDTADSSPTGGKLWTCGTSNAYPLRVFSRPTGYENRSTPLAEALHRQLEKHPGLYAKHGWRLIFNDGHQAELVRGTLGKRQPGWVMFEKNGDVWDWRGSGGCMLAPVRKGARAGSWRLGRGQKLMPYSTSFKVEVSEMACAGGAPPGDRVLKPVIDYFKRSIVVTYFVKSQKGTFSCPGAPPTVKILELERPRLNRPILDGGTYPYPVRAKPKTR